MLDIPSRSTSRIRGVVVGIGVGAGVIGWAMSTLLPAILVEEKGHASCTEVTAGLNNCVINNYCSSEPRKTPKGRCRGIYLRLTDAVILWNGILACALILDYLSAIS